MIRIIRYISVLFWLTCMMAVPVNFIILPGLIRFFPRINPVIAGIMILLAVLLLTAFLMDLTAKKILAGLIREGQAWERSGIIKRARKKYIRAFRLFDSFLICPFFSKKTIEQLTGVAARFQLNTGVVNENFSLATIAYLKMNPTDKEIARLWLRQLRQISIVTSREQDVLSVLADCYDTDPELSLLMTDIFLGLGRTDFAARKLYSRMLEDSNLDETYAKKIEQVAGRRDESDSLHEQALFAASGPVSDSLREEEWSERSEWAEWSGNVRSGLRAHFKPLTGLKTAVAAIGRLFKTIARTIGSVIGFIVLSAGRSIRYISTHDRFRFYLKCGMLTLALGWLVFFTAGTVLHLYKSEPVEKQPPPIVEELSKPFTIQVASYLKQSYADRYMEDLKKKGLDASVKKVAGGGKTWFVVKVSSFADKKSAAAYGRKLKQQKLIDDFFVNNN